MENASNPRTSMLRGDLASMKKPWTTPQVIAATSARGASKTVTHVGAELHNTTSTNYSS